MAVPRFDHWGSLYTSYCAKALPGLADSVRAQPTGAPTKSRHDKVTTFLETPELLSIIPNNSLESLISRTHELAHLGVLPAVIYDFTPARWNPTPQLIPRNADTLFLEVRSYARASAQQHFVWEVRQYRNVTWFVMSTYELLIYTRLIETLSSLCNHYCGLVNNSAMIATLGLDSIISEQNMSSMSFSLFPDVTSSCEWVITEVCVCAWPGGCMSYMQGVQHRGWGF